MELVCFECYKQVRPSFDNIPILQDIVKDAHYIRAKEEYGERKGCRETKQCLIWDSIRYEKRIDEKGNIVVPKKRKTKQHYECPMRGVDVEERQRACSNCAAGNF